MHNDLHTPSGHIAVGWLVVEDLFTVVALVLLPALFGTTAKSSPLWLVITITALKVSAPLLETGNWKLKAFYGLMTVPSLRLVVPHE